MPANIQRQTSQRTQVGKTHQAQSRGSQGGFWGQILQHTNEGQTVRGGEQFYSQNSEPLVTIASESVTPGGSQKQRKIIPESLRSLHTIYTDYDEDYDNYYNDQYYEGDYDNEFELVNLKTNKAEIQTVEDTKLDEVLRTHQ